MITIELMGEESPFPYVGQELHRCLNGMCGEAVDVHISVGLFSDFSMAQAGGGEEIGISVHGGVGRIAAKDRHTLLYAAYRFLRACGAAWVLPGRGNEYLPRIDAERMTVELNECASYPFRGVCIEGAVSVENVQDMIDWLPKYGFNSYFLQFREAHIFFERWYSHRNNELLKPEPYSVDRSREYTARLVKEIKKRGLLLHMAGHGWTCEPLGLEGLGWDPRQYEISEEVRRHLALVGGKREIWKNIALDTNLCYSQPETRQLIVEDVVRYLQGHPETDVLHFWLSDGQNNVCECEGCNQQLMSDFYLILLGELDEKLSELGIQTKIVFLLYQDTLWPPQRAIPSSERFILMFAPITRTYTQALSPDGDIPPIPAYVKNHLNYPKSVEENLSFLRGWQEKFRGSGFLFDYHLMWDHLKELGYRNCAKILYQDVLNLTALNLDGYISCQLQRVFLPNALPMVVLGEALWNRGRTFEEITDEYFKETYGLWADKALSYLDRVSGLFDSPLLRLERPLPDPAASQRYRELELSAREMQQAMDGMKNEPALPVPLLLLRRHCELLVLLAQALGCFARKDAAGLREHWNATKSYAQTIETEIQPYFDVFEFVLTYEKIWTQAGLA